MSRTSLRTRAIAILAIAGVASAGVYATFTDSVQTERQDITSGTGELKLTNGSLKVAATSQVQNLIPGDWVTRDIYIQNDASFDLAALSLAVTEDMAGNEFTTSPEGLRLTIERETNGVWSPITEINGAPLGMISTDIGGPAISAGGIDHLRATMRFVGPNESQSLKAATANLTYTFEGTQRAARVPAPASFDKTAAGYNRSTGSGSLPGTKRIIYDFNQITDATSYRAELYSDSGTLIQTTTALKPAQSYQSAQLIFQSVPAENNERYLVKFMAIGAGGPSAVTENSIDKLQFRFNGVFPW